jgi:hypothetical protein
MQRCSNQRARIEYIRSMLVKLNRICALKVGSNHTGEISQ